MRRRLCLLFACGVLLASAVARTQSSPAQAKNDAGQTNKDTAAAKDLKPIMMYRFYEGTDGLDRKSTRLNSSHYSRSRMPSSA